VARLRYKIIVYGLYQNNILRIGGINSIFIANKCILMQKKLFYAARKINEGSLKESIYE
jgi:hypothetical protein